MAVGFIGGQTAVGGAAATPYEIAGPYQTSNDIDKWVMLVLQKEGVEPAYVCSDEVFVRRVFLDTIGTLPRPEEVRKFLADRRPNRRAALIDDLLTQKEFADYQSLKWCDVLRVKAEFPINLWPNAVQAYHQWIRSAIAGNMPYDQFARELLTSSGSNFRVPPVNFYRAIQGRESSAIASAVALTFMGIRFDGWSQSRRDGMAAFFSRIKYKPTAEWKEEIVHLDPAPADSLKAIFPDGKAVQIPPGKDPREVFADWLITADNPWFSQSIVNRIWSWLMGRGIIHEPDDIRPDNPAVNPELLVFLEKELVKSKYDLRHVYRLILNSRTYQQSSIPRSSNPKAEKLFAYYPVRRLEAEVLVDVLCWISGDREGYTSPIPEPFTFVPEENRTIELADGSTSSLFLEMFGRPSRDTGLESERNNQITDAQRLHLLNSTDIQKKIESSKQLKAAVKVSKGNTQMLVNTIYLTILSRYPTQDELAIVERYFRTPDLNRGQAANDLAWSLINTKEFLYRH